MWSIHLKEIFEIVWDFYSESEDDFYCLMGNSICGGLFGIRTGINCVRCFYTGLLIDSGDYTLFAFVNISYNKNSSFHSGPSFAINFSNIWCTESMASFTIVIIHLCCHIHFCCLCPVVVLYCSYDLLTVYEFRCISCVYLVQCSHLMLQSSSSMFETFLCKLSSNSSFHPRYISLKLDVENCM